VASGVAFEVLTAAVLAVSDAASTDVCFPFGVAMFGLSLDPVVSGFCYKQDVM
jgi:hypothetical protein